MINLKIANSECIITGLSDVQYQELRDILSYSLSPKLNYYTGGYQSLKRYLIDVKGRFPTGVLYFVQFYLQSNTVKYNIIDTRVIPKGIKGQFKIHLGHSPYPEQVEAVETAAAVGRGTIAMPTGFGKSICMALLVQKMQLKTLVIVPNLELKRQLTDSFTKYFGKLTNITIENIDSRSLEKATDYDCLIIDEAHHVAAKTYRKLNKKAWTKIYHRYFFTATPFRSRDEEQLLFESIAGQVIYRVTYQTAVEKGYIVPMEAYYYELPRQACEGTKWPSVYSKLVVSNDIRNHLIANLIISLGDAGIETLCLVNEIKHGEAISALCGTHFANGKNEDTQHLIKMFSNGKLKSLIGTSGIMGEGIDTKPAKFIIIAGLGKSRNRFMQQVGRAFRVFPGKEMATIILFLDKSHKWTREHFKEQCKILLDEYNIIPKKLDYEI